MKRQKNQRGSQANRERRRGPDVEAIVPRDVYERGVVGVGYAHKFRRASELFVDRVILKELGLEEGDQAPYEVDAPRHVTSMPFMSLDPRSLAMLQVGRGMEREAFKQALREKGYDPKVRENTDHEARIIDIHAIGGRVVLAEIDCVPISLGQGVLRTTFSEAGVPIPELYAPHFKVGTADTMKQQTALRNVARSELIGEVVNVEPIDAYFATYTQRVRPDFIP